MKKSTHLRESFGGQGLLTKNLPFGRFLNGAAAGGRTQDLGLKRPLLYQLSYRCKQGRIYAKLGRLSNI